MNTSHPEDAIRVWDLGRGEEVAALHGVDSRAIFDADGALLTCGEQGLHRWPVRPPDASASGGAAGAWRIGPAEMLHTSDLDGGRLARSRDGRVLSVTCFNAGTLVVHRDRPDRAVRLGPQRDVRQVAVSPDGRWVATGSWNGTDDGVFVWDAATGRRVAVLPAVDQGSVDFSPDGRWLAVGVPTGRGRLWRAGDWSPGPEVDGAGALRFSPDGALLAHGGHDHRIRLLDPETCRPLATLEDPNQDRAEWFSIGFTPDGTALVASGDESRSVHVWDLRLIREGLASRGLDWDRPPYPPPASAGDGVPERREVRVEPGEVVSLQKRAVADFRRGAGPRPRRASRGSCAGARPMGVLVAARAAPAGGRRPRGPSRRLHGDARPLRRRLARDRGHEPVDLGLLPRPGCRPGPGRPPEIGRGSAGGPPRALHDPQPPRCGLLPRRPVRGGDRGPRGSDAGPRAGGTAYDHLFLSMAHGHLGHADEARAWADRAALGRGGRGRTDQRPPARDPPLPFQRLELQILAREASALIGR